MDMINKILQTNPPIPRHTMQTQTLTSHLTQPIETLHQPPQHFPFLAPLISPFTSLRGITPSTSTCASGAIPYELISRFRSPRSSDVPISRKRTRSLQHGGQVWRSRRKTPCAMHSPPTLALMAPGRRGGRRGCQRILFEALQHEGAAEEEEERDGLGAAGS
jgi:hypothetical protein